ncbi:MAG TPA: zf-HC2 domain-containing protein [Actinomycetota bacterium]|nr:zf-HC2 domain-containing protein [Actinomycetota bacterium]
MDDPMNHDRCSELLRGYLAGELSHDEAQGVRAHLAGCEDCRAEERTLVAVGAAPVVPMDDLERARLHRALAQELFTPRANADVTGGGGAPRWTKWIAPAFAGAAVIAGVFAMTTGGGTDESTSFGADSAEGGAAPEALEDSQANTESGGGGGRTRAGPDSEVSHDAAASSGEESAYLMQSPAPEFVGDLGSTTTRELSATGRSGEVFRSAAAAHRASEGDEVYDDLLGRLVKQAGDAGDEVDECAATLPQDGSILPAYGGLARYDDRDVLVLGFVTNDPGTDELGRYLLWVWERGSCEQPLDTLFGRIEGR